MGRYYSGDIEGKFWFAVQSSDDADNFGVEGEPLYNSEDPEEGEEPYALYYYFSTDDLETINEGIDECHRVLGDYKEKLDNFFEENPSYSDDKLAENIGCSLEEVKILLANYARLELGDKIKKCVEENECCGFDAEL
jgi:hypothetical protein